MMRRFAFAAFVVLAIASARAAEKRTDEGVGLTIYASSEEPQQTWVGGRRVKIPSGYATVKEWRRMDMERGVSKIRFTDVAKMIKPETVHFASLTDPAGTFVIEQNYEYDLLSAQKLLDKYIDRRVTLLRWKKDAEPEPETVTLLSNASGNFVVRRDDPKDPIEIFSGMPRMRLGAVPGGLITRPTLVWALRARRAGTQLCKVTYETGGISWKATYTAVSNKDDSAVDLAGWVTIDNQSGATYKDAEIKLVAGDVHASAARRRRGSGGTRGGGWGEMRTHAGGFSGKAFFEFHLYTLGRKSTVKDNSKKQLELFSPVAGIPARKMLVYHGASGFPWFFGRPKQDRDLRIPCSNDVDIYLTFRNSKNVGLGIPLPEGTVRVYKEDPEDGSLEFVGEDETDHASRDEDVMLRLGTAFDVIGERRQTEFKCDYKAHWMEESFEIALRNHKDEDVEVVVREILYRWVNWKITSKSDDYEKVDSRTVHFPVRAPKDGEKKLTYTVKYTW